MRTKKWPFILLLLLLSTAQSPSRHKVVRTSENGVPLVRTEGGPKYSGPIIEIQSELIIGIDEGEPEWQMFARQPRLLVAENGTMVLVDSEKFEIYIVSESGELLAQSGREGSGPGEFRDILDVFWAEKNHEFWLSDQLNSRITRFRIDGELLGSFNYGGIRSKFHRFYSLTDRRFLGEGMDRSTSPTKTIFGFLNTNLELVETFLVFDDTPSFQISERQRGMVPFTTRDGITLFPDGRMLISNQSLSRLTVFSTDGEPQLHIEREWQRERVTRSEKSAIRRSYEQRYGSGTNIPFPDYKPIFGSIRVDEDGRIWERERDPIREEPTGEEPGEVIGYNYQIYSTDGIWIGTHQQRYSPWYNTGVHQYWNYFSKAGAPRIERLRIIPLVPEMQRKDQ